MNSIKRSLCVILYHCSKLTFDSCLQRVAKLVLITFIAFNKVCSVHVFITNLLSSDEFDDKINIKCVFKADSLFLSFKQTLSIQLQIFNDE